MIRATVLGPTVLGYVHEISQSQLGDLGQVGRCPARPTLVIPIVDDSGSIAAPGGADPISNRYSEMRLALRAVARRCRCKQELAAVLHFDSPAGDAGPEPLTKAGLMALRPGLAIPLAGAGTSDLLPSLLRATELAEAHPGHESVVVIFSDFALTDRDHAAVAAGLVDFPGVVYACVLGTHEVSIPGIDHHISIGHDREPGAVAHALIAGLTHHRLAGSDESPPSRSPFHNALSTITGRGRPRRLASGGGVRAERRAGPLPHRRDRGKPGADVAQ